MKKHSLKILLLAFVVFAVSCSDDDEAPKPIATANPPAQIISSGETTAINLTSTISGTTFSWTVVQTGVTGASAGSGSTIAQTLTVDGVDSGTATYTIVPTAGGIVGDAIIVEVTVDLEKITYMADVKPLLTGLCAPCHVAGGTHPSKWDEYNPTKNNINSIINRVKRNPGEQGFMPQGGAKLSDEDIAILEKWVVDGVLEQ
jgi:hypothetical protein